jgi:hypothetical protein
MDTSTNAATELLPLIGDLGQALPARPATFWVDITALMPTC